MSMITPEFSRRVAVSRIGAGGFEQTVQASSAECLALAERLAVPAVISLSCRFRLEPPLDGRIAAAGELRAEVTRICVVSLEAFECMISERFAVCFVAGEPDTAGEAAPEAIDPEAPDELPFSGGIIDLGETAAEQLALALDPYPRMPGVPIPGLTAADDPVAEAKAEAPNPFAALARLRGGSHDA